MVQIVVFITDDLWDSFDEIPEARYVAVRWEESDKEKQSLMLTHLNNQIVRLVNGDFITYVS